jgi:hypothetical protein
VRTYSVRPTITGDPAPGFKADGADPSVLQIEVRAEESVHRALPAELTTEAISIEGAQGDVERFVRVTGLPSGATIEGEQEFRIRVRISGAPLVAPTMPPAASRPDGVGLQILSVEAPLSARRGDTIAVVVRVKNMGITAPGSITASIPEVAQSRFSVGYGLSLYGSASTQKVSYFEGCRPRSTNVSPTDTMVEGSDPAWPSGVERDIQFSFTAPQTSGTVHLLIRAAVLGNDRCVLNVPQTSPRADQQNLPVLVWPIEVR